MAGRAASPAGQGGGDGGGDPSDEDDDDGWDPIFEEPYYCHECEAGFEDLLAALEHSQRRGVLHKFFVARRPAVGDHVYTAQYKDLAEEANKPIGEHMSRLMVDLISLPEHHGVFAGYRREGFEEPEVIHFDGCVKGVFSAGDSQVSMTPVAEFTRGQTLFVQPYEARLSGVEALYRAHWALSKRGYHCQTFNCEHFAVWCCTGVASSKQAWYSSVFVDPVFPFGWAAVMAKDSTHCAVSWMSSGSKSVCFCGQDAGDESGGGRGGKQCESGHFICQTCWREHQARTASDTARSQHPLAYSSAFSQAVVKDESRGGSSSSSGSETSRQAQEAAKEPTSDDAPQCEPRPRAADVGAAAPRGSAGSHLSGSPARPRPEESTSGDESQREPRPRATGAGAAAPRGSPCPKPEGSTSDDEPRRGPGSRGSAKAPDDDDGEAAPPPPPPPPAVHAAVPRRLRAPVCCLRPSCWAYVPEPRGRALEEGGQAWEDSVMSWIQSTSQTEMRIWALGLDGRGRSSGT